MKHQASLTITNLHAGIEGKEILRGVTMSVAQGQVHVVMGPNGSGKSTLASVLLGHPSYAVYPSKGKRSGITLNGRDISGMPTEERAKAGLFMAFQSPVAIPGVTVLNLLRSAYEARAKKATKPPSTVQNPVLARRFSVGSMSIGEFQTMIKGHAKTLSLSEDLLSRGIHDGFSGGERKKIEMLQALVLPNSYAIFDEIDTGLDVDALKSVSKGIEILRKNGQGIIIITHYQRMLRFVVPDVVHILVNGRIVASGDASLAKKIETQGYGSYLAG